ncbi:MAG: SGNH/GDSL hydrolase family protein [Victivallaceae bacterium]|nr:SGNH/GDSL hydrolase family protein [Victivallaceae bacterium]
MKILYCSGILFCSFLVSVFTGADRSLNEAEYLAGSKSQKAFVPIKEDPGLPRVLLLGDSISIGYTLGVRRLLKDKANVIRPPANCRDSAWLLAHLDKWLGTRRWDVIHFNCGIWDNHLIDDRGKITWGVGRVRTDPRSYELNLRQIAARLKRSANRVIWASATPVPAFAASKREKWIIEYNRIAAAVMQANGIQVNDLYSLVEPRRQRLQSRDKVHFNAKGYEALATQTAVCIEKALHN